MVFYEENCSLCGLSSTRKNIVVGKGNQKAKLMFVGEGPGADEDEKGIPFCGRAGKILDNILKACDLTLDNVYICNTVMCRPPENRNPKTDEVESCKPFLLNKIDAIKPYLIITLGKVATSWFLQSAERGMIYRWLRKEKMYPDAPEDMKFYTRHYKVLPLYHPAALLYNPNVRSEMDKHLLANMTLIQSIGKGTYVPGQ